MQRLKSGMPDDLQPEDLLTDEQPRARDPPRAWWRPDDTVSWTDITLLSFVYSLPAITLLLREC